MIDLKTYNFDPLKMYFGENYIVKTGFDPIIIRQPTLGDIIEIGENVFYSTLYTFVGNPTMFRLKLWDIGVDWNKISDYQLFCMLIYTVDSNVTKLLFGDLDFYSFEVKTYQDGDDEKITLFSEAYNVEISEDIYCEISEYLRLMFNIHPKVEKAKGKTTKEWMIEEEREKLDAEKIKPQNSRSTLLPTVSFCVNHPGFKYKTSELKEIGIVQFMDSVKRLQIYENTSALVIGQYTGMCDLSKVDKNLFDFVRDVNYKS